MTAQAKLKDQLLAFFNEAVQSDENLFLVDFYKNPKKNEFIFLVDGTEPVNLPSLSAISRQISAQVDELIEDETPFSFQISTPGADKPLKDLRQYYKHTGRLFIISTQEGAEYEGNLISVEQENINLAIPANKKKKTPASEVSIPYGDIKEAAIKLIF